YDGQVNPPGGVWPCIGALAQEVCLQDDDGHRWIQPSFERYHLQPERLGEVLARVYAERASQDGVQTAVQAREATRLLVSDLARLGVPVSARQRLVDWMADVEAGWVRREAVELVGR